MEVRFYLVSPAHLSAQPYLHHPPSRLNSPTLAPLSFSDSPYTLLVAPLFLFRFSPTLASSPLPTLLYLYLPPTICFFFFVNPVSVRQSHFLSSFSPHLRFSLLLSALFLRPYISSFPYRYSCCSMDKLDETRHPVYFDRSSSQL